MKTEKKIMEPSDKPIADLMAHAMDAIRGWQQTSGMTPHVMFKHTCGSCGQRGFVNAADTVPTNVRCEACNAIEPFDKGGYSLAFELQGTAPHGDTATASRNVSFNYPKLSLVTKSAPQIDPAIPVKIGCRMEPDQTITPIDRDALHQFVATLGNQIGGAK